MSVSPASPAVSTHPDAESAHQDLMTFRVGLWSGILFLVITLLSTVVTMLTGLYAFGGILLTGAISLVSFGCAWLAQNGRARLGSALLISSVILAALFLPLVAKSQGLPLAIVVIVTISSIASYTQPPRWANRATLLGTLLGVLIILADLYLPDFGLPTDPRITTLISAAAGSLYALAILRRYGTFPLRVKIIVAFLGLTLIPVLLLGWLHNTQTRELLNNQAQARLSALAAETSTRIYSYLAQQMETIFSEAQQPGLRAYLQLPESARTGSREAENARRTLEAFASKNPGILLSYALLNTQGVTVLESGKTPFNGNESGYAHFTVPLSSGQPYISNVIFITPTPLIVFSAPVQAENGTLLGVLRVAQQADILQAIVEAAQEQSQAGQRLRLLDRETSLRLATTFGKRSYTALGNLSAEEITRLQTENRLPLGSPAEVLSPEPEFIARVVDTVTPTLFSTFSTAEKGLILVAAAPVTAEPWVVTAEQPESVIYLPATEQVRTNTVLSLGLAMLALLAALLVSQVIARPVTQLAAVAGLIAAGDLSVRANLQTADEVGDLAHILNDMAAQLSQTVTGLEERVSSRTRELESANQDSAQRARQLQLIAEISRSITREQNIDKLLPLIADVVSNQFGYYHIGIFLLDEGRRTAILQASNSPGGQKMLARGHALPLGASSIVGFCALTARPRLALDVGEDVVFFNNPSLPSTHSELALPLIVHGLTIGVLDLQSEQKGAFTEADISSLSILADQIAIAIENALLFRRTQTALNESQAVVQSYLRQEWAAVARRQPSAGYLHSPLGGKVLSTPLQSLEIDEALSTGEIIQKEGNRSINASPILTVPIKIGQQIVGAIRIQSIARTRDWKTDEINLIRAISERIGLALENARLIATSQRRATKERTISEMTTRISASTDMETILKTTVQELGQVLAGADVVIQLEETEE